MIKKCSVQQCTPQQTLNNSNNQEPLALMMNSSITYHYHSYHREEISSCAATIPATTEKLNYGWVQEIWYASMQVGTLPYYTQTRQGANYLLRYQHNKSNLNDT